MTLYHTQSGTGKDILLVHGWASSGRMWDRIVPMLSDQYRCWVPDLPGNGESPLADDQEPTIELYAQALYDFCSEQDFQPYAIIAHSMGGLVALKLLNLYPDFTERLILISSVVTGAMSAVGKLAQGLVKSRVGISVMRNSGWFWNGMKILPLNRLASTVYSNPEVTAQAHEDFVRCHWKAIAHSLVSIAHEDMTAHLPQIRQKTMIVVGTRDFTVPPKESHIAAEGIPNVTLRVYEKTYHLPHEEKMDLFKSDLLTFLR